MPDNQKKDKFDKEFWLKTGLVMFAESTGWIAIPVVSALFLGRWLDNKYDSAPLYFLSITIFAFIISSIGIGITGVKYMKRMEEAEGKESNKKIKEDEYK